MSIDKMLNNLKEYELPNEITNLWSNCKNEKLVWILADDKYIKTIIKKNKLIPEETSFLQKDPNELIYNAINLHNNLTGIIIKENNTVPSLIYSQRSI